MVDIKSLSEVTGLDSINTILKKTFIANNISIKGFFLDFFKHQNDYKGNVCRIIVVNIFNTVAI